MPRFSGNQAEYLARYRANSQCFGGNLLRGNPKGRRPFSSRSALHIVLRSSLARGRHSLLRGEREFRIKAIVKRQADRFSIQLYRYANSGNHLHLLVKPPQNRSGLAGFLRAISGLIARAVLQAERGSPKGKKFWDKRPFSRIVGWGKAFGHCAQYIARNVFEASNFAGLEDAQREWQEWRQARQRGT